VLIMRNDIYTNILLQFLNNFLSHIYMMLLSFLLC